MISTVSPSRLLLVLVLASLSAACGASASNVTPSTEPDTAGTARTSTTAALCSSGELAVAPGYMSPAEQERVRLWTIKNTGPSTCSLRGYPSVQMFNRGRPLGFRYLQGQGQFVSHRAPQLVTIPPDGTAYFVLAKSTCVERVVSIATTVTITLPGLPTKAIPSLNPSGGSQAYPYCADRAAASNDVAVSPVSATVAGTTLILAS